MSLPDRARCKGWRGGRCQARLRARQQPWQLVCALQQAQLGPRSKQATQLKAQDTQCTRWPLMSALAVIYASALAAVDSCDVQSVLKAASCRPPVNSAISAGSCQQNIRPTGAGRCTLSGVELCSDNLLCRPMALRNTCRGSVGSGAVQGPATAGVLAHTRGNTSQAYACPHTLINPARTASY